MEVLRSKKVKVVKLESDDMKDWGEFLSKFYKKIQSIEPYHMFSCDRLDMTERGIFITNRDDDLLVAKEMTYNALKQGFEGRNDYPKGNKGLLNEITARPTIMKGISINVIPSPGINPYKQVELFTNYHQMMPEADAEITCPKPPPE